jgi:hypothetical protein
MSVSSPLGKTVDILRGIARILLDPSELWVVSRPMSMGLRPDVGCNHWQQARGLSSSPADRARSQKRRGPVVSAA